MASEQKKPLKAFLCHASGDKPPVRELYNRLVTEGVDAWLDKEKLLPGQDWQVEIPRAVGEADVVVVCLSNKSITKEGYVQKEIKFALDIAEEKPEGTIFLIPARLEDCTVPERLSRWQWVDLYEENGFTQLLRSLKLRADLVGASIEPVSYEDTNKEREQRVKQLYTEGLAAFYTEDWDRACQRFQTILSEHPNHKNAAEKLEEAECQGHFAKLYIKSTEAIRAENWDAAIRTLEELCTKSPEYKDARELLRNAIKQKHLRELYAEAKALHEAQKWDAVLKVFDQISRIDPNYADKDGLLLSAQKESAELQHIAALNDLYSKALDEMDAGKWPEARTLLEQIHKAQTGFLETEKLLRKVEDEILKEEQKRRQNDQIDILYEQAHGLIRSKSWNKALEKINEIQKLDDKFIDKDELAKKAQAELEREEQEAQKQNQLAGMYAEAVRLLKEEKYQEALDKWQEVKVIDPKYPDRQWVQTTGKRKLAGARKPAITQNNLKINLGSLFQNKAAANIESFTVQTQAGWLILIVAITLAIGRFLIEWLSQITNIFGAGINLWGFEIIMGSSGLMSGIVICFLLRFLNIHSTSKKTFIILAGWTIGYSIVFLIGWQFTSASKAFWGWRLGYFLGGLIAGLLTAIAIYSPAIFQHLKQVVFITLGIAFSIFFGNAFREILQTMASAGGIWNPIPQSAESFVVGLFSASILYNQLTRPYDTINFAKQAGSILLVAIAWGIGRFFVELLARITNFFTLGITFWCTEIIFAMFGLIYGVTILTTLRFLKIEIRRYKMILLIAGWFIAFLLVPVIGWSFAAKTKESWTLGYLLAGTIAGLFTAIVLISLGSLSYRMQIFIITIGIALGIYSGEKASGALITDLLSIRAIYPLGIGSFIAGLISALILVSQLSGHSDSMGLPQTKTRFVTVKSLWMWLGGVLVISIMLIVVSLLGGNTIPPTITSLPETCPTYPIGTNDEGFISSSADPIAPWTGIPVTFQGTGVCGISERLGTASLIYRYRIEFKKITALKSVTVSGAAFNGPGSILRVLDKNKKVLKTLDTVGGNTFQTQVITLEGVYGRIFFIDEFDTSGGWRYRQSIKINDLSQE